MVDVGNVPVGLNTTDGALLSLLERRFDRFLSADLSPEFQFDVTVVPAGSFDPDADLRVGTIGGGRWTLQRGDFHAEWDVGNRRGWIRQTLNPYAIDSVLRIVHTLVLAAGRRLPAARVERRARTAARCCSPGRPGPARRRSRGSPRLT